MIAGYGWSTDSEWFAYWSFTAEEAWDTFGAPETGTGRLHFFNALTGQSCQYSDEARYGDSSLWWQPDGTVVVATRNSAKQGRPCAGDVVVVPAPSHSPKVVEFSLVSPGGHYRVTSVVTGETDNIASVVTQVIERKSGQIMHVVKWRDYVGVGMYGPGWEGEWLTEDKFLVYETLDAGPLLVEIGNKVVQVAPELFGVSLDAESRWYATGAVISGTNIYHLLLFDFGVEADFSPVRLYHSETGEVETLPFQHAWGTGFSTDGQWLLLEKRPIRDGVESQEVWFRLVDPSGSPLHRLAGGFSLTLQWSPDRTKVASFAQDSPRRSLSPGVVQVLTFPEATPIGRWTSEDYDMIPQFWSPDGRFLVVGGYMVGLRVPREALFVIRVP